MMITNPRFSLLTLPAVAVGSLTAGLVLADDAGMPFAVADVYAELNDTDGDLGLHALIDGDAWRHLEIESPAGRELLELHVKDRLRRQGLTELFFESAEPPFDELSPEEFFDRFPEGRYEIEATTLEGDELESIDRFSHALPAPPGNVFVGDQPAATDCDAPELPAAVEPVQLVWHPVTTSHPSIGRTGEPIVIARYELVVEFEFDDPDGQEKVLVFAVDLRQPDDLGRAIRFDVPQDFTANGEEFKFEILAVAEDGNRTAIESCFEVDRG